MTRIHQAVGGEALGPEGMMAYQETFVQRRQHRIYVRDHPCPIVSLPRIFWLRVRDGHGACPRKTAGDLGSLLPLLGWGLAMVGRHPRRLEVITVDEIA